MRPFSFNCLACAFAVIALLGIAPGNSAHSVPDGGQIYSLAVAAMHRDGLPDHVRYRINAVDHGILLTLSYNAKTHHFNGSTVSIGKINVSRTVTASYDSRTGMGTVTKPDGQVAYSCWPFPFAPTVPALASAFLEKSESSPSPAPSGGSSPMDLMKVIVSVEAFSPGAYEVRNLGLEKLGSHSVYHLTFTARDGNESAHPLTDALIDTRTYLVRSLTLGGGQRGFIEGGGGSGTYSFGNASGHWVVKNIKIVANGHFLLLHEAGSLTYTFSHFTFS